MSLLFLLTQAIGAQNNNLTQTIKGAIIDQASEEPIMAANILIIGTEPVLGTATDYDGSFKITGVPVGRYTLRFTCIGYEDAYIHELEVGSGKEIILNIKLAESLVTMDEVVVKAQKLNGTPNNEMASVSARSFSVEQTKRYAAAANDPARMAMSFAGVSSRDDLSNEIIVRGNSPRGVLWRMEGVEISSPNHFSEQGASGGGISALSVNMLANSDFLISAFPAEYGNATSGVFDLKMRNGNNEKREYALQAGLLGLDLAAEGPIGEKEGASYLVNYRYSTLALLEGLNIIDISDGDTRFQDAAFKVHIPNKNTAGYTSVWGIGGLSSDRYRDSLERFDYVSNRGVVGANNRRYLKRNDYIEISLSYATDEIGEDYEHRSNDYEQEERFVTKTTRASLLYNRKMDARNTIRAGVVGSHLSYDFIEWVEDAELPRVTNVDEDGETMTVQAYTQWKKRIGTNLHLNIGTHAMYTKYSGEVSIEPRAGIRWNYKPGHTISAGGGLHSRMDPLPIYFARVDVGDGQFSQPNKALKLPKAIHGVLGYEWRFHPQWRLQAETYYQHLYDVPIMTSTATSDFAQSLSTINFNDGYIADSLLSDGTGRNYGIEVTVEKFFTNGWYALGTASVYQSLYTARDGVERDTRYNGGYVWNVLAGKEWSVGRDKNNVLGVSIRSTMAGGNRFTPIDLESSRDVGYTIQDHSRAWEEQGDYYFRTDFKVSYRKNKARTSSIISLDIQNVSNRENVWGKYYSSTVEDIQEITQFGMLPILNYRLEF